jgi:hypothetical protein
MEQEHTDNEERSDDVDFDAPFDTMCVDESRDDDLPIKHVNKMNRYSEMKIKVPNDKPELPDVINYEKPWVANPPHMRSC